MPVTAWGHMEGGCPRVKAGSRRAGCVHRSCRLSTARRYRRVPLECVPRAPARTEMTDFGLIACPDVGMWYPYRMAARRAPCEPTPRPGDGRVRSGERAGVRSTSRGRPSRDGQSAYTDQRYSPQSSGGLGSAQWQWLVRVRANVHRVGRVGWCNGESHLVKAEEHTPPQMYTQARTSGSLVLSPGLSALAPDMCARPTRPCARLFSQDRR